MRKMVHTSRALDDIDRALLSELVRDGRVPNNVLAERVGIAPSTCLYRVRALRASGVLRGIHADLDLAAIGRPVEALIAVRLRAHVRAQVEDFARCLAGLSGVISTFSLAGGTDFLVHVAVVDPASLRELVYQHITSHPAVRSAETSLVFDHQRARIALTD